MILPTCYRIMCAALEYVRQTKTKIKSNRQFLWWWIYQSNLKCHPIVAWHSQTENMSMYRVLRLSILRYSPSLVRIIGPELDNSEKCFILVVTKKEPWSSRQPLKIKIRSKWIKYGITIERKLNSSAHDTGGFIIHGRPGCAMTPETDETTPSLEDKFNTPGIVLIYPRNVWNILNRWQWDSIFIFRHS